MIAGVDRKIVALAWSGFAWIMGAEIIAIYASDFINTSRQWLTNENYAHGIFVYPLACFLIWLQRDALRCAPRKPELWGLLLLALGLLLQVGSVLLRLKYIGMWSLLPTLAGSVLALFGRDVWRIVQFPVWFLLFADPIPQTWLVDLTRWIQGVSVSGSYSLMSALGFTLIKQGNLIEVPGATLEVAQACSGFHKLLSLLTFSCLYSYLFSASLGKKLILIAAAIPIAVLVNILRISFLIAATSQGGMVLMHRVHDLAEIAAIVVGFLLFILLGKGLGCRFISSSPAVGCLMALTALTADHAVGKLEVARSRRLSVENFPIRIGEWQGGAIQPVDPSVQQALPTSAIHERVYTAPSGQVVDCMLVTASDSEDLHDPAVCFPSQGWALSNIRHAQISGQATTLMDADNGTDKLSVMYWTTGYYQPKPSRSAVIRTVSALRTRLVGRHEGVSLVVRLICSNVKQDATLLRFAQNLTAPLDLLKTQAN